MRDLRSNFIRWYNNEFHQTEMFQKMNNLAENSPWHREDSIGIHTDMVVTEYISNVIKDYGWGVSPPDVKLNVWNHQDILGALVCAFHDVGKPEASARNGIKWKPERGNYLSFGSHELLSARMWEDFAVQNWDRLVELFDLEGRDILTVGWMIEHHLPWGVKKAEKRHALAQTVVELDIVDTFVAVLVADTWGRISDDGPEKKQKVKEWIDGFLNLTFDCHKESDENVVHDKVLFMPIAPSGSGKTTFRKLLPPETEIFSMDDLRIERYLDYLDPDADFTDEDYNRAYQLSTEDKGFNQAVQNRFNELLATENNIFCDNTNTSARRRRHYITAARRKGYHVQGVLFPISLDELIRRQTTRTDKTVPTGAVVQQYQRMQYPSYGDFDSILVLGSNL